jgi:hypothetical protein
VHVFMFVYTYLSVQDSRVCRVCVCVCVHVSQYVCTHSVHAIHAALLSGDIHLYISQAPFDQNTKKLIKIH